MPITITIDLEKRRVYSRAEGLLSFAELLLHMRKEAGTDAASYPEVFDCTEALISVSASNIRSLAEHRKAIAKKQPPGPVAFVGSADVFLGMFRMFDTLTGEIRPISMFATLDEAEAWLDSLEQFAPAAA